MPMVGVMNAIAQASAAPVTGPKLDNRRVLAGVVDLAIVTLGAVVILFAGDALSGDRSEVQGALGAVILGWALYYYFALESGAGQTVGKKLMKLRVVKADGSPAGMGEIAVRTSLRVVDGAGAYIVGLIVMLATGERRQRLGDIAAGTMVIDASASSAVPAAEPVEEAADEYAVAEGYEADAADDDYVGDDYADDDHAGEEPTSTITLPARPERPSTLADLAEEPEPVEEPESVEEEPVAEELSSMTSPSLEELARDVEAAQAQPVEADEVQADEVVEAEPVAVEPVEVEVEAVEVEPVEVEVEPVEAEAEPVDAEPVEDEGPVTVKSVETVSAIDLIMGGSDESSQDDEDSASQ